MQNNKPFIALFIFLLFSFISFSHADTEATTTAPQSAPRELSYTDACILGLVEGITEYLPVSSTGHLILVNRWLGLDDEGAGSASELQFKRAVNAYAIVIQAGAIAAVVILYWKRLLGILNGFLGNDAQGFRLGRNLIIAFIPAAILGPLLDNWIESVLFGPIPVIIALVVGAIFMLLIEQWRKKRGQQLRIFKTPKKGELDLQDLSMQKCLFIGVLQCVAMWPGTSRSMMTIIGGYFVGLKPARAAEFSFLLGLITLTAASGYKLMTTGSDMVEVLDPTSVIMGIIVAAVSAAIAVKWLVSYLNRHGLSIFAWYRIGLAIVVAIMIFT